MRVFKFGGASVKDAESVKNVASVLKHEGVDNTLIVISAMGKMTNAFEDIINSYAEGKPEVKEAIEFVRNYHFEIINNLFEDSSEVIIEVEKLFGKLSGFLISNKSKNYDFIYDQLVGFGELLSTTIISHYFNAIGIKNEWIDVRNFVKTDSTYRDANIKWKETEALISELDKSKLYITQGFLGSNNKNETITLGREGSDFSAAIFAHCLNAESLIIWKDVDGVLNADPRYFEDTQLLEQISYSEAIEMAFYGASVIHPKTLKPLENKNIPLYVRSFTDVSKEGTVVGKGSALVPDVPCFILKQHQILLSISALDFSFMVEHHISNVFKALHKHQLKVNLIQNSALSFSVCIEDKYKSFYVFLKEIEKNFNVNYWENSTLYTVRHAKDDDIKKIEQLGNVLLKQSTQNTIQIVMNTQK